METNPTPKWPQQPNLEAFFSQGNPYPGTEELEATEGKDWWKFDEDGKPIEPDDDPEDN